MLVELHGNPENLSPEAFADAVSSAGLDAVVLTRTNSIDGNDAYYDALESADIDAFAGVELGLEKGAVVFIPADEDSDFGTVDWSNGGVPWTLSEINECLTGLDGVILVPHPYYRDENCASLGDRVYQIKQLGAVTTRVGRGRQVWDRLA